MSTTPAIQVSQVSKCYGSFRALDNVDLQVTQGEFFGRGDVSPWLSLGIVSPVFIGISLLALGLIKTGYKLR